MKKIWRSLTFNLTQALYPLIPDLYQIFNDLATNEYISAKQIRQISQNIYIIISAIMLFALGIKLISAIVNPDLLDDKKKGAKQTFFRCVAAVFLIVLIPMGFNLLNDWQAQIVENQLVEKVFLGMDTSNDSKPGQVLAAYGFASFCYPNETVSVQSIDENYNQALTEDISKIDNLDDAITSKTDGEWDLNYHPILSPAVGFFLVYEMVVICMDIALRSIKLALLQLIAPIIISAYVLTGNDVLQKYAKEVLSTFALLFLKIGMITFMIFGLSIIPNFLNSVDTGDRRPLYIGLLRVFIIIGLFQLIKQFPDIFNKIFGTNFKYRGGIRGRLGEMQGVGEMAQKAWDKVRTVGTNLAKVGAVGLGVAASGPLGWGALAGAGVLAHGWRKGIKWGPQFGQPGPTRDTAFGRGLRKFGAGAKAVGTGLTTSGGLKKAVEAGIKSYDDSGLTKDPVLIDTLQGNIKKDYNVGSDNRLKAVSAIDGIRTLSGFDANQKRKLAENFGITDFSDVTRDAEGNLLSSEEARRATAKRLSFYKDALKTIEARDAEADVKVNRDKYLKGKMSKVDADVEATEIAARNKSIADAIKSKHGSLVSTFDDIASNTTDDVISKAVASLKSDFVTGQVSSQMAYQKLSELLGSGDGYVRKFKSDANKYEKLLMNDYTNADGTTTDFGTAMKRNTITGGFVITDINDKVTDMETVYNNTKGSLDQKMAAEKFNETQKATVESLLSNAKVIFDSIASTSATFYNINDSKTGTISFGDGVTLPDMENYNVPTNNQPNKSNEVDEANDDVENGYNQSNGKSEIVRKLEDAVNTGASDNEETLEVDKDE